MAVKSIIDIEVNASSFLAYQRQWAKYQASIKAMPAAWQATHRHILKSAESFRFLVNERKAELQQAKLTEIVDKRAAREVRTTAEKWRDMARSSKDFAANIGRATSSLLRWTALTSVVSGIVGLGGLFGIDRIAAGAASQRRSSGGLGLSVGEQSAFEVNYGRLVNPGSFLGAVSEATSDASKRYGLYSAGLSERDVAGKSTGEVATALIASIKKKIDATPTALLGQLLSTGVGNFIGLDEARRLKARGAGELGGYRAGYGTDVGRLGLSDKDARRWEDFIVKLDEAGRTIETGFIRKIAPLAPGLTALSESVTRTIESLFGDSKRLNTWLEAAGAGLETLGKYLGSSKFQEDVKSFADAVGTLAEKTVAALQWLGLIPGGGTSAAAARPDHRNSGFGYQQAIQRAVGAIDKGDPRYFYSDSALSAGLKEFDEGNLPLPRRRPDVLSHRVEQGFDDYRTGSNPYSAASEALRSGLQLRVRNLTDAAVTLSPQTGSQTPVVLNQLPQ